MARYAHHRRSHEPRIEMAPMLDVIFLLLTFFIYSVVLTVRAEVLPVRLPLIQSGLLPERTQIAAVTVDRAGHLFLNQEPLSRADLERRLAALAERPDPPAVFLALEAEPGEIDRGPVFIELIDMMRRLGIEDFHLVGRRPGRQEAGGGE